MRERLPRAAPGERPAAARMAASSELEGRVDRGALLLDVLAPGRGTLVGGAEDHVLVDRNAESDRPDDDVVAGHAGAHVGIVEPLFGILVQQRLREPDRNVRTALEPHLGAAVAAVQI